MRLMKKRVKVIEVFAKSLYSNIIYAYYLGSFMSKRCVSVCLVSILF